MVRKLSLIDKVLERFGIRVTLMSGMVLITTLACIFVIANNYIDHKDHIKVINQEVENRLTTSAYLAIESLGRNYHDKIVGNDTFTSDEYDKIVDHFNKLCVKLNLEYLWSLMRYEEKIVFTSSTSQSKDVSKQDHAKFFDVHTDPQLYELVFRTMEPVFQTNIDKWGSIKVVLVPFLDIHGRKYLFGSSIKTIDYNSVLYTGVRNQVFISLLFVIAVSLLSVLIAGRISEPVVEKVKESEFQYQTTLESMDDVIHVIDSDFNLILANQALRKQSIGLGIQGDLIGRNLFELFLFLPENINKEYRQVFDTGKLLVTEEETTIQGEDRYTETRKIPVLSSNRVNQVITVIRDITDRKQAEKNLRDKEARFRMMFERSSDAVFLVDLESGHYLDANKAAEILTGRSVAELRTLTTKKVTPHKAQERLDLSMSVNEAKDIGEVIYMRPDGSERLAFLSVVLLNEKEAFGIARDITEKKLAEEALKKSHENLEQKVTERTAALQQEIDERKQIEHDLLETRKIAEFANNAKSEFLSNVSHEFRTPMHQILSYSKFGVDKIDKVKKEKLLHYFSKIGIIGKNLLSLLNDLLDLSKLEAGKVDYDMRKHDLKHIVDNVLNEFDSLIIEKGLFIKIKSNNISMEIILDEVKIGQVIRNLLSNAIKFTPKAKKIIVSFKHSKLLIGQRKTDNRTLPALLVQVSDQGIGIPIYELDSIFDKFAQSSKTKTNAGGTGLGLAICEEIIKAHNGKIWAENNPEGGAKFSFMLPYEQEMN